MENRGTVLIVGANRGVGFELGSKLLQSGYLVYGTHRPETKGDPSVSQMIQQGIKSLEMDFTDEESIIAASKHFSDQPLDVLINCAGVYYPWDDKPFTELTADDLISHFKVNTVGPFLTSKHFLSALAHSKAGKIINISSDLASIADNTGGNACYRISKCALNQLTKNAAMDLEKIAPNVKIIAVHPGYVPTKMTGYVGEDDMVKCIQGLGEIVERFGTPGEEKLPNGGYVRWSGEIMRY
ncbi:unnamed protein product [Cyclocybe aegerita]|uniref:NAD(P)-binding protein n=1 Tax=Cyclocybe aegerita TaxID=1973307 RepID=A0A8S0XMF7_CYCAE|nr:unnamed protein product [Cyclocybe aegerita]